MDQTSASQIPMPLVWVLVALVAIVFIVAWWVRFKTRPMPGEHVFRASRISRGNRIFPAQVAISASSITMLHPQWIGKLEESIHIAHVSSIKIDTNIVFSDVLIETTGGHHPIVCHGHTKSDAVAMKKLIERFQTDYYQREKA
jgi:hypothetical protein